jgi:hypothetical protein
MKKPKIRTSFYLDKQDLIKFKVYCVMNNISMCKVIAEHIKSLVQEKRKSPQESL